ncbi:DUF1571 domain-containing protein [Roseimaritima sediminicola]|uniref:DUF1571 domain-containing protein n=1 Tax=Roseimaritima sediminicola TaxID=2662066 RepID=UPI00129853FF|nr:DUF1571 domain-containing protein [Roseimaritima sediminicola]
MPAKIHPTVRLVVLVFGVAIPLATAAQAPTPQLVEPVARTTMLNRVPEPKTKSHPLDPALAMAQASLQHIQNNVHGYTALFVKRCRVDGVLPPLQYAQVKVRNRKTDANGDLKTPLSVYLKFLKPSDVRGREVIWVEGENEGKMIVHESGLKGMINVHLDPHGYLAMRGQRYPITEIGIENLVEKLIETGNRHRRYEECQVQFYRDARIGDVECTMLEVVHPERREHFDFHRARVYFDKQHNLPIRYESYSWPEQPGGQPVLEEEYSYVRLKVNPGLGDPDFDISNPEYDFR